MSVFVRQSEKVPNLIMEDTRDQPCPVCIVQPVESCEMCHGLFVINPSVVTLGRALSGN